MKMETNHEITSYSQFISDVKMYTIPLKNGITQEKSDKQKTQVIPRTIHGRE